MSEPKVPLAFECLTGLAIVGQLYTTRLNTLLQPFGISAAQFGVLNHIVHKGADAPLRITDIARAVEVGQPAVTKTIAKFETMGLVALDDDRTDRRAKAVRVEAEAVQLLTRIYKEIGPHLMGMFTPLDRTEMIEFTASVRKVGQWLDKNRL